MSARLIAYTQFPPGQPKVLDLRDNCFLGDQLMEHFPDRNNGMNFTLWRNSASTMTEMDPWEAEDLPVVDSDLFVIQFHPGKENLLPIAGILAAAVIVGIVAGPWTGAALGVSATTGGLIAGGATLALGVGAMVASNSLMTVPKMPNSESTKDKSSGSSYVDNPQNQMRSGSRVPEVFGRMRVWPDLIAPPFSEFNDNYMQKGISYYCVSEGYCSLEDHRLEATPITGGTYKIDVFHGDEILPRIKLKRSNILANNISLSHNRQTDYFPLIGDKIREIHWDIMFPKGLLKYKSSGGTDDETVEIKVWWRRVYDDGTKGPTQNKIFSLNGKYENPWIRTLVVAVDEGKYEASVVKNTDGTRSTDDIHVHDTQLGALSGVEYIDDMNGKGKTYVRLEFNRSAVSSQAALLFNYNCIANRHLNRIDYDVSNIYDNSFEPTSFLGDALAYTLYSETNGAGVPQDQIDWASLQSSIDYLYGIEPACAEFNGVFDRYTTVEEQLKAIATVGRIVVSNHYGKFFFTVDKPQEIPVALFNRRNRLASDVSNLNLSFATGDEPDCIQIDWKDANDGFQPQTFTYPTDVEPLNPLKIDGTGIVWYNQVYRRARYEWETMKYRRRGKTIQVTEEAQLLLPLSLIAVVEPWSEVKLDGEVKSANGLEITLDKNISGLFDKNNRAIPGMTVRFRSFEGTDVSPLIGFDADPDFPNMIWLHEEPPFPIGGRDEPYRQIGTLFDIGLEDRHASRNWLVTRGQISRSAVELTLIEYAPDVYTFDAEPVS